jgi:translation initiation factor IF-3
MKKTSNHQQHPTRVNEKIRLSPVMVIKDGDNLGSVPIKDALEMARIEGMDLVEVSPNSRPPVCRIMDYGKYQYEKGVKEKNQKKKGKASQIKEIRLRPSIDDHDVETKINAAKKFLLSGNRVQLRLFYKKRENVHRDRGFEVIERIIEATSEVGDVQNAPKLFGTNLTCLLEPKK